MMEVNEIWKEILLNWLNKCVLHNSKKEFNDECLGDVFNKYSDEICYDDEDKSLLTESIETFLDRHLPKLKLRSSTEMATDTERAYILTSVFIYYFCVKSKTGQIYQDICDKLRKDEQELILEYCEILSTDDITINNIEDAIKAVVNKKENSRIRQLKKNSDIASGENLNIDIIKDAFSKDKLKKSEAMKKIIPQLYSDSSDTLKDLPSDRSVFGPNFDQVLVACSDSKEVCDFKGTPNNERQRQDNCSCTKCGATGQFFGDPGRTPDDCQKQGNIKNSFISRFSPRNKRRTAIIIGIILGLVVLIAALVPAFIYGRKEKQPQLVSARKRMTYLSGSHNPKWVWECNDRFCHKKIYEDCSFPTYSSFAKCSLLCHGPQLWPYPLGLMDFSKSLVHLSVKKLEYKINSVPSDSVRVHLAEAFQLFIKDLTKLENSMARDINKSVVVKKLSIQIYIESDPEPKLRLNTDEAYNIKINTNNRLLMANITAGSFCGARHGLETLSQLILLDDSSGYLITLSHLVLRDAPTYNYRGLMLDTARNYIPVVDLLRTIDAMSMNKLNTFHWRISDATSFPLVLSKLPKFNEYGPYDRSMVYSTRDIKVVVKRAEIRGIRVVMEVTAPGPVGRAWSWLPEAICPNKAEDTCPNILCIHLPIKSSVFSVLELIYSEILNLTKIDDVFHLSDGFFLFDRCYNLLDSGVGFLDKALASLKKANKGLLPKLPIIWYTPQLRNEIEAKTWERFGVQLYNWDIGPIDRYLYKFKVIHSTKWDLTCTMMNGRCIKYRSWQEMYTWKSWQNIDAFTVEGGEAILWTDVVDSTNLDDHVWPRTAAVAERLWSDVVANTSVDKFVFLRLESHRRRMVQRGIDAQPVWPVYCFYDPTSCFDYI